MICYRDEGDAEGGRSLQEIIQKGLIRSRDLIVILTPEACASSWVLEELLAFKLREDARKALQGHKFRPNVIFPIFVAPSTPDNLPEKIVSVREYLGAREDDIKSPSETTVSKILESVPRFTKAFRMYGATTGLMLALLVSVLAFQFSRMEEFRKTWRAAAERAEAAGRMDQAEWLVAKASESGYLRQSSDAAWYARLRARRMLVPDLTVTVPENTAVMALFNTAHGLYTLESNNDDNTVEFRNLEKSSVQTLLKSGDYRAHSTLSGQHLLIAAGDQLICQSLTDASAAPECVSQASAGSCGQPGTKSGCCVRRKRAQPESHLPV